MAKGLLSWAPPDNNTERGDMTGENITMAVIILPVNPPIGIYIHIPFCQRKCTYCSFNTTDYLDSLSERYSRAVCGEIAYWSRILTDPIEVDSIYLGGGTPSIIPPEQLAAILGSCHEKFNVHPTAEITIEINP